MSAPRFKLFPHPTLSLVWLGIWLLLANSMSIGNIVLGAILGFTIPFFAQRFWPIPPAIQRWGPLFRLFPVFVWDVIVANVAVAWLVINVGRTPRANWIVIPLDISNEFAIWTLGSMITMTPGTVTAKLTPDRRKMLVHVLDTPDPAAAVKTIKQRYEGPLKEIFE